MMRIILLFVFAVSFGLVVFAQNYDSNSNLLQQNTNFCTGGACRIDKMKPNEFFQNDSNSYNFQYNNLDRADESHNRGGLNNNGNYTYDFNCQFGSCLPQPSGSYNP